MKADKNRAMYRQKLRMRKFNPDPDSGAFEKD